MSAITTPNLRYHDSPTDVNRRLQRKDTPFTSMIMNA